MYVIAGARAFGRPTMFEEDEVTLERLYWRLNYQGEDWAPSVSTSADRQWVEKGATVRNIEEADILSLAFFQGQDVVLRWDE